MDNINYLIENALSSTQIILIFVSILFNIFYLNLNEKMNKELSESDMTKNKNYLIELKNLRLMGCVLIFIFIMITLLFSRLFIEIILQFIYNIMNNNHVIFDFLLNLCGITQQTFSVIYILIWIFLILTISKLCSLCKRIKEVDTDGDNKQ